MSIPNSVLENPTANIIVITGNDETLQNILSIIQKTQDSGETTNLTRYIINESAENKTVPSCKRRKTDLTCMICDNECSGYNYNVISCGSCKSFFHRNISQKLDDLKCLTNTNKCDIKFNNHRRMCQRCRLRKCLTVGMKWNSSAKEEKLNRQRELEKNRRSTKNAITTFVQINCTDVSLEENTQQMDKSLTVLEPQENPTIDSFPTIELSDDKQTISPSEDSSLTLNDHNRINLVKSSGEKAFQSLFFERDISELESISDQRSALLYSMSTCYDMGMRLITFIRNIPEFELLNEQDRFTLFKHNSPLVFFTCLCLHYDTNRDLVMVSEIESDEYTIACNQLSSYCFGEQLHSKLNQLLRSMKELADSDPITLKLLMVILVFVKGVSVEDIIPTEELILTNIKQVYEAESIYTSLLFRYLIRKYSTYHQAVRQYSRLIQKTIQMQMLARKHQKFLQEQLVNTRDEEINPVMKSILNLR